MTKNTVKLLDDIIITEFNDTRTFLLSNKKPINNDVLKRYVLNIRNNIITLISINNDIILTRKEKEFVNIMITSNITKLVSLISKCNESVSVYYIGVYLNSTRDKCVKEIDEYYSKQIHKEFTETLTKLFDIYTDMIS